MSSKILYVVPKGDMIREAEALFTGNVKVISLGTKICGESFDEIWIDEDYNRVFHGDSELLAKCTEEIRELCVRVNVGGRMRYIQ